MYEINLIPSRPGIAEWRNLGSAGNLHGVWIPEDGVDGFSATPSEIATSATSVPGQMLHGLDYGAITGSLELKVLPESRYITSVKNIYRRLVESFHPMYESVLEIVDVDGSNRRSRTLPVRLASPIRAPSSSGHQLNNSGGSDREDFTRSLDITLDLIGDQGYWGGEHTISDGIITNSGDLPIYAVLGVYVGSTGRVQIESPSGSQVVISATPGAHLSIGLDPSNYFIFETTSSGQADRWDLLPEVSVISEQIPPWNVNWSNDKPRYQAIGMEGGTGVSITTQWSHRYLSPWT